jgi:ribosomal protein S18 acetylase RimI-like enzyme
VTKRFVSSSSANRAHREKISVFSIPNCATDAGQSASYRAQYPNARFEIVELDASSIGRIITDRTPEALLVIDVALDVPCRNRGIGTALMRRVIGEAHAAGLPVRLSVFTSNSAARRFYLYLGFKAVGSSEINTTLEWREPSYSEERRR